MRVRLAYGRGGLSVDFPDDRTTVIEPTYVPGLPDEAGAILTAIRNPIGTDPLRRLVQRGQKVVVSVCDVTRPMPSATVLPVLMRDLAHVPDEDITILVASGTHRSTSDKELKQLLGTQIVDRFEVVNHDAFDARGLVKTGETSTGVPIWLNRRWVEGDVRITVGFVEPHFFAGYSGGPKMVAPGLAGFDTIMRLHNAEMISHPDSRWGVTEGNPIHDAVREIAGLSDVAFSVDVTINRKRKVTSVYAGELFQVHKAGCDVASRTAMQGVDAPFEVVVTTNSGYPLDQNLYQAVKGMSAAAQVVRRGGAIICAAECSDGIPEHGEYGELLGMADDPKGLLDMICAPGHNRHDQWQVQIQAQIQAKASVYLKSDYLTDEQVRAAHLEPIEDIGEEVAKALERFGSNSTLCVLPEGPQTIPYVNGSVK